MSRSRAEVVDRNVVELLEGWDGPSEPRRDPSAPMRAGSSLSGRDFLELLESLYQARHLDLEARRLKERGTGYYTIGSAGHEGNAAVAAALRPDDPAFLHYRSGAFFAQRARQVAGQTPIFDVLLSLCASADDPIAGGRHKVFGSRDLWIPPQTSTIASHLPKAMGAAFAIGRAKHVGRPLPIPHDAVVACSFGDASLSHSTALGALNAAMWAAHQHLPMPVVFVCEDNGLGISVHTPERWIEDTWGDRPDLPYFSVDGTDLVETFETARRAIRYCRRQRRPVLLHLRLVRLLGHAGSDIELAYRDIETIKATEARDPVLLSTRRALEQRLATSAELLDLYREIGERVAAAGDEAARRPHLDTAAAIVAPLAGYTPDAVAREAERSPDPERRRQHWEGSGGLPEEQAPMPLGRALNAGLHDLMLQHPEMLVFGEDVGRRGGVYGITAGLWERIGGGRVFNTLLDEQSILGAAIGAAHLGFLPVPEIQYLAYFHHAADQIRGEAASLQFFSEGRFRNPVVARIQGWAYQKGFGGHFHNDNGIASLRDIPGVVVASPARGDDAVGMLRTCMAMARADGRVILFVEPIALYAVRDLHEEGDGAWAFPYPAPGSAVPFGAARTYGDGPADLTIVSWANGLWRSLRAARRLEREDGIAVRLVDLRWLQPLDRRTLLQAARDSGALLVVDEGRRSGGVSEAIFTLLLEGCPREELPALARTVGEDTFIPLGPAWHHVLPSEETIVDDARALLGGEGDDADGAGGGRRG